MPQPIIQLKTVSYRYPQSPAAARPALASAGIDIAAGEFVSVVGANGSGKSTLARLLNGLIVPDAGEVLVEGRPTSRRENLDAIRQTVGMVFQNPDSQIVAATIEDDIAFGMENIGLPREEIGRRMHLYARRFGVDGLLERPPHLLSGGQKQRVVLAGVMALEPRVLVLDEAASMLDSKSRRQLQQMVAALWCGGTTVIDITHDMEEVARAPRVLALAKGEAVFDGPPRRLFSERQTMERAGLLPPLAVRLTDALNRKGYALPAALTLEELVESACS